MDQNSHLSEHAREFVHEVQSSIDHWHDQPLLADLGTSPTRARLLGLASDMIRLIDSAEDRGWDVRDLAYQITVGLDDEEQDEGRVDVILSTPADDDLDRQFDTALCRNSEEGDVARPIYDGDQFIGGRSAGRS